VTQEPCPAGLSRAAHAEAGLWEWVSLEGTYRIFNLGPAASAGDLWVPSYSKVARGPGFESALAVATVAGHPCPLPEPRAGDGGAAEQVTGVPLRDLA